MESVHVILTGGTINKVYDPVAEKPEMGEAAIIPSFIERSVRPQNPPRFETLFLKDSLIFTEEDRAAILGAVKNAPSRKIVIVHGTGTMETTAEYLLERLHDRDEKTVILTGSVIPLKEFAAGDGGFNLGYALAQVEHLPHGVYICMNAQVFKAGHVRKNVKTARFEAI